jgi:hypothetical protein
LPDATELPDATAFPERTVIVIQPATPWPEATAEVASGEVPVETVVPQTTFPPLATVVPETTVPPQPTKVPRSTLVPRESDTTVLQTSPEVGSEVAQEVESEGRATGLLVGAILAMAVLLGAFGLMMYMEVKAKKSRTEGRHAGDASMHAKNL